MKYLIPQFNDVITLKEDLKFDNKCKFRWGWRRAFEGFDTFINNTIPAGTKLKVANQRDIRYGISFRFVYGTELYSKISEHLTKVETRAKDKDIKYMRLFIPNNVLQTIEMELERK